MAKNYSNSPRREEEGSRWKKEGVKLPHSGGSNEEKGGVGVRGRDVGEVKNNRGGEEREGGCSKSELSINGRVEENNLQKNSVEVIMCEGEGKNQKEGQDGSIHFEVTGGKMVLSMLVLIKGEEGT